jgi:hypothetical protein
MHRVVEAIRDKLKAKQAQKKSTAGFHWRTPQPIY